MAVGKDSKIEKKKHGKKNTEEAEDLFTQEIVRKTNKRKHEELKTDNKTEHDGKKKKKDKKEKEIKKSEEIANTDDKILTKAKKRKADKKEDAGKTENEQTDICNPKDSDLKPKKKRKGKDKSNEESSLGVIDQSILQQAGTNLGLPLGDEASVDTPKEKKKKKKDKKADPNLVKDNDANLEQQETTRWSRSLVYLKQWATDRDNWRFKKASQVQLLKIMYDKSQMSDDDFVVMLQYLEDIKGKGRDKSREDAEKLLKDDCDAESNKDPDKTNRARQIFQLLS